MIPHARKRDDGMSTAKTEAEWSARAKRFLKAELKRADMTYE